MSGLRASSTQRTEVPSFGRGNGVPDLRLSPVPTAGPSTVAGDLNLTVNTSIEKFMTRGGGQQCKGKGMT